MEMERIIVAFETPKSGAHVRDVLESGGVAQCLLCRSAAEVKRLVHQQHITAVICGFKLADQSAEALFADLPPACAMLMIAVQSKLDLCRNEDIFLLPSPVGRGDLIAAARMLLQIGHRMERFVRPQRTDEAHTAVLRAKALLKSRDGMTEEQAHYFLQKQSMDSGRKLVETAKLVLGE